MNLFFKLIIFTVSICSIQSYGQTNDKDSIVYFTEVMAEYPGGLQNYIDANLKYPQKALKRKIEGRVVVQFCIEPDGSVSDINVMKSSNTIFNKEAIRLIKNMEKWKPATQNNKPVKLKLSLPLNFKLN